jgi:hypothetical protein
MQNKILQVNDGNATLDSKRYQEISTISRKPNRELAKIFSFGLRSPKPKQNIRGKLKTEKRICRKTIIARKKT